MSNTDAPDSPARSRLGPVQSGSLRLYTSKYGSFIPRPPHDQAMRQLVAIANRLANMSQPSYEPGEAALVESLQRQMRDFHDAQQVLDVIDALVAEARS